MNLYPWLVVAHVTGMMLFFIAHGVSMFVGFRLRTERDPARVAALLDLSAMSLGIPASIAVLVGFLAGVAAGFVGGWWGQLWIWVALVLFVVVALVMTPMAASRLNAIRAAAGTLPAQNPFVRRPAAPPPPDPIALERALTAWNPVPVAALGLTTFVVILALMLLKPF